MNLSKDTQNTKNALSIISLPFAMAALFIGLSISEFTNHRQYTAPSVKTNTDNDGGIDDMNKFFFDARKNPTTNKMDYPAMVAADRADQAMAHIKWPHSASMSSATSLPAFNWNSLGPAQTGGRTRGIVIDNQDHTGQTIFAGGVSGGIWKSTNGGTTWDNAMPTISYSLEDTMPNLNISCLFQDVNGVLYAGTGELFPGSEAAIGDGIFTSTDDGNTWHQIASTAPTPVDESNVAWAYVNRIAVRPDSVNVIYAATNLGVYISHNSGTTWGPAITPTNKQLWKSAIYNAYDLKISNDGSVVVACIGGFTYLCYPQTNSNIFTEAPSTGPGHINGNASRIEYAIAPTDANRIYASEIASNGSFCKNVFSGIYMTETAKTNEGYWYLIGPGGSTAFDPYVEPASTDDQAIYDDAMGVSPANEGEMFTAGTTLWKWEQTGGPTDTIGNWSVIGYYGYPIHPDMHVIVFDQNNPNNVFIGCDGGVYKSTDGASHWAAYNRNYNTTQYYTLCYSPYVKDTAVSVNNTLKVEGLGMGGGTQDNGSPYITGNGYYPNDGYDLSGGDGAGSAVSQINPNIAYFCSDNGYLLREGNLSVLSTPISAYTLTYGNCLGGDIDSMYEAAAAAGGVAFVLPVALYENEYDTLNSDFVQFIAPSNYAAGATIYPNGINGTYPYVLTSALAAGDTITVPDRVVSRLATGFSGPYGIWINGQAASNQTIIWKPIGGPLSKPDAYTNSVPPVSMAWSPDGDALFVGCEGGTANLYRFSRLNKVVADKYCSGALWYKENGDIATNDTTVYSKNLTFANISGADILSIAVDPKNGNNVLITLGGYGGTGVENVWYSTNALGASPTFKSVQGHGLPPMPVYSAVLDVLDSTGNSIPGSAVIATEHGVYSTTNINAGIVQWVKNNNGMANCLSYVLKQQTQPAWECNNASAIYLATYGRGIWNATDLQAKIPTAIPAVIDVAANNLLVYPNPMTTEGNISYTIPSADHVTLTIYDMQGNIVTTMDMGTQAPGNHIVPFGTSSFRAGTYFASLTGTDFRKVSKFIVTR